MNRKRATLPQDATSRGWPPLGHAGYPEWPAASDWLAGAALVVLVLLLFWGF